MDFHDTKEEAAFRAEVREFVRTEAPKATERGTEMFATNKEWTKKLADRHWVAPAWPKEYGGAGLT